MALALGLGWGFRGGAGLGLPTSHLALTVGRGLGWGLVLRVAAPLHQLVTAWAVWLGGLGGGVALTVALALGLISLGLRDLRGLRRSSLGAALEAMTVVPKDPGCLPVLSEALLGPIGISVVALVIGLALGLFGPGPDAFACLGLPLFPPSAYFLSLS